MNQDPIIERVKYESEDTLVFVKLREGKIDLYLYLSNECLFDDKINEVISVWAEDAGEAVIKPHFSVSSLVDYLVTGYQMPVHDYAIDMDAKPVFEALRAEFIAQIERIDALTFKQTTP